MSPPLTVDGVEQALFEALAALKRAAGGPFGVVDRFAGEATAAGIEGVVLSAGPAALLAFEASVAEGTQGALADTILHDDAPLVVERHVFRVYVSVTDLRGDTAALKGTTGQPGVLRCADAVKRALVGLRIRGLWNDDRVRLLDHRPWSIRKGAHYVHIVRVSAMTALGAMEDPPPAGATPLDEIRGDLGPEGAPIDHVSLHL